MQRQCTQTDLVLASGFFELGRVLHNRFIDLAMSESNFELPMSSMQIMMMIDSVGPVTISEISHYFSIAKPNVTPMVDKMTDKNYVHRIRDKGDKRIVHVDLTEEGHHLITNLKNKVGMYLSSLCDAYGEGGSEQALESLDVVLKILSAREA